MKSNKVPKTRPGKKQQKKKIIVTSVAVGAAGILGYFGWKYLKKKRQSGKTDDIDAVLKNMSKTYETTDLIARAPRPRPVTTSTKTSSNSSKEPSNISIVSEFPLKKGSKGTSVKILQQALLAKYGKAILPKYGADGDFGSETESALKKVGYPTTIDQSTFNVITQIVKIDPVALGKQLYSATVAKNYSVALSILKKFQSTADYATANDVYKEGNINGVRQTIVNGLLNTFSSDAQKQAIKFEFLRMGLQFDGSKWSLSGFDGMAIVTVEPATVWVNAKQGVKVPSRMVLGNEVSRRLDYTLFENNGKYFLVDTRSVQYLN
jgi:peptidoglycan hydrolase-like protein with peptidoglycan-binding domain